MPTITKKYRSPNHGLRKYRAREYNIWGHIKRRCYNPSHPQYKNYGGRGIRLSENWLHDPLAFYNHIIELPHYGEKGYTLDRIDNDGDYESGNVRWATRNQQSMNRRVFTNNTSGYRGVTQKRGKFMAYIDYQKVRTYLGYHHSAEQAALAYDCAVIQIYGDDAPRNLIN